MVGFLVRSALFIYSANLIPSALVATLVWSAFCAFPASSVGHPQVSQEVGQDTSADAKMAEVLVKSAGAKPIKYADDKARLLDYVHLGKFCDIHKICDKKIASGTAKAYEYQASALAWLYQIQQGSGKAVRLCQVGLEHYPDDIDLSSTLAVSYARNLQWSAALKQSMKVLDVDPKNVPALTVKAICLHRDGREDKGLVLLRRGLAIDPGNEEMNMLVVFYAKIRHKPDDVYVAFDRWNQLNPRSAVSYALRGEYEYDDSIQDAAMKSFQKAVSLNPEYVTALYKMGKLYWNKQSWSAACTALLRYEKLGGHNETGIVKLHDCLIRTKQYKEAVRIGEIAIEMLLGENSRREEALGVPGFAVVRDSSLFVESQVKLAIAYFYTGETEKATQLVKAVLKAHPDNVPALDLSQKIAFKTGNYSSAISTLSKLIVIDRDVQMWYLTRADAYKKMGDTQKAKKDLAIVDCLDKTGRLPENL